MLHDQTLTDASYENGVLRLTFGAYKIYREDFTDDACYNRYKDYHSCMVEILIRTPADLYLPTLMMFKGDRYKRIEPDYSALVTLLKELRAEFTYASVSSADEMELQLFSVGDKRELPREVRYDEFRLSVYAEAINFIWK